jgi:hypothetical protein
MKIPGLPKFVPADSTPVTVIFFDSIKTQGKKQAMINARAAKLRSISCDEDKIISNE